MFNILVVEDNIITRNNIVKAIEQHFDQCTVYQAENGKTALSILNENEINLFLLDIELPDISGMEVAKQIRKIPRYEFTFLVFITSHVVLMKDALHKTHCYDFIEKPFKMEAIIKMIDKLVYKDQQKDADIKKQLTFKTGSLTTKYNMEDIYFIFSQGKSVDIHTKWGVCEETHTSLKAICKQLEEMKEKSVLRSHKAYIVNSQYIRKMEKITRYLWRIHFEDYEPIALVSDKYLQDLGQFIELE